MKKLSTFFALMVTVAPCSAEPQFMLPEIEGATPWTEQPFTHNPEHFQFAIISDRTGGMRRGVFDEAVDDLNLLHPEFVIAIGDMIDGYTEDQSVLDKQWNEFEKMIERLDMKFFRLAGNHDISNQVMIDDWRARYGPSWYHFLYHDVLFLCLNTEDPPPTGVSAEQVEYFRRVLDEYPNPRHTFVFMHRPLWSYGGKAGYERIETLLEGREYTLFSGHHHNYLKVDKEGNRHFILATTGGGSWMRGPQVGEFDHITWVTVTDDGPRVAHLEISGIRDENLVTENSRDEVDTLRHGRWFSMEPIVHTAESFTDLQAAVMLRNPASQPLTVSGVLEIEEGIQVEPQSVELVLEPNEEIAIALTLVADRETRISELMPVEFELNGSYESEEWGVVSLPAKRRLVLDWSRPLPNTGDRQWIDVGDPGYVKEDWDWHGTEDGLLRFKTWIDAEMLNVHIEAHDDVLIHSDNMTDLADKFFVALDARPREIRSINTDSPRERGGRWLFVEVAPQPSGELMVAEESLLPEGTEVSGTTWKKNLKAELRIPLEWVSGQGGEDWDGVRLNIGWMDHDRPENTKPSIIWWKPPWDHGSGYNSSGMFFRQP